MSLNKNLFLMAVTALATVSFSSAASAQEAINATDIGNLVEDSKNAAAAIRVEYNGNGDVTALSAASAFGKNGAAAIATPFSSAAVGSSESSGSIIEPTIFDDGFVEVGIAVDFGGGDYEDGFDDGFDEGGFEGYSDGLADGFDDGFDSGYIGGLLDGFDKAGGNVQMEEM